MAVSRARSKELPEPTVSPATARQYRVAAAADRSRCRTARGVPGALLLLVVSAAAGVADGGAAPPGDTPLVGPDRPAIVVGFPKTGTSSITRFFQCAGLVTTHWGCKTPQASCAQCLYDNRAAGRPLFAGCNPGGKTPVDAWCQLDSSWPPGIGPGKRHQWPGQHVEGLCYWPQLFVLPELAEAFPNATWILNTRPVDKWLSSMDRWGTPSIRHRTTACLINTTALTDGSDADYAATPITTPWPRRTAPPFEPPRRSLASGSLRSTLNRPPPAPRCPGRLGSAARAGGGQTGTASWQVERDDAVALPPAGWGPDRAKYPQCTGHCISASCHAVRPSTGTASCGGEI
mmetsp:Transcript_9328/g.23986  ORF Transcript_9328/g.23986 Transcript_9328/m.23986 type:complete len:346 (+) Transcript_9328:595-1632(+)